MYVWTVILQDRPFGGTAFVKKNVLAKTSYEAMRKISEMNLEKEARETGAASLTVTRIHCALEVEDPEEWATSLTR